MSARRKAVLQDSDDGDGSGAAPGLGCCPCLAMAGVTLLSTTMTSTASTPTEPTPAKPPGAGRLPSLNQLAARINSTAHTSGSPKETTSAARPRLAAFALRTGSNVSVSTAASTSDSIVANAPTTRAVSPAGSSTSQPQSATVPNDNPGGEALTTEKLEQLNLETVAPLPEKKTKVGYKNIPSLDAITARLAKTRALSIDGTAKPPEPEFIEDPKTPGVPMKAPEHPLQYPWYVSVFHLPTPHACSAC